MTTQTDMKAFKQRSIVLTMAVVLIVVIVVIGGVGVGIRFALPSQWEKGMHWVQGGLDRPMLNLFRNISTDYVNDAPDMEGEEKRAWGERFAKMATALREEKGTADRRKELREVYEGIVEEMKDGDLTKAELAPFQAKLDQLLEQIETEEVQKQV
ncbi:MAG: hypothetical protein ACYTHM_23305 [Planctomycetota bacterium]|jgi:hypothetical protein